MKRILKLMTVFFMLAFAASLHADTEPIEVGIFVGKHNKTHADNVTRVMKDSPGIKLEPFYDIADISKYRTVIFWNLIDVGEQPEDWAEQMVKYCGAGGGLILISRIGNRLGKSSLGPNRFNGFALRSVVCEQGWPRGKELNVEIIEPEHPVVKGIKSPYLLKHGGVLPTLAVGPQGKTLAVYQDKKSAIVVGDFGRGKVVAINAIYPLRHSWKKGWQCPEAERAFIKKFLVNSIKWTSTPAGKGIEISAVDKKLMEKVNAIIAKSEAATKANEEAIKKYLGTVKNNIGK